MHAWPVGWPHPHRNKPSAACLNVLQEDLVSIYGTKAYNDNDAKRALFNSAYIIGVRFRCSLLSRKSSSFSSYDKLSIETITCSRFYVPVWAACMCMHGFT